MEKVKTAVFKILRQNELARNDDFILYKEVLNEFGINLNAEVGMFLEWHLTLDLPPFESVTRCRRKIQKEHPELASEKMKRIRQKEQEKYIELSRE